MTREEEWKCGKAQGGCMAGGDLPMQLATLPASFSTDCMWGGLQGKSQIVIR